MTSRPSSSIARRRLGLGALLVVGALACSKNINITPESDPARDEASDAAAKPQEDALTSTPADASDASGDVGGGDARPSNSGTCTFKRYEPSPPASGVFDRALWRLPEPESPDTYDTTFDMMLVLDNTTHLIWDRSPQPTPAGYDDAVWQCANFSSGPFMSGWRLPTRSELLSLVAWSQAPHEGSAPAGLPTAFYAFPSDSPYWSSTRTSGTADQRWAVSFGGPTAGPHPESTTPVNQLLARCVHAAPGAPAVQPAFEIGADCGVVRDTVTKLEWQRDATTLKVEAPVAQAVEAHCRSLDLGPTADRGRWRAPKISELFTLVDSSRANPANDDVVFPTAPTKLASGTSVTIAGSASFLAGLDLQIGLRTSVSPGETVSVRCVREAR
ncbi:MAG: DUF1566 domain-containing protein [Deltaproteobacteria bacterium]|nr:DUF1566 domain-containing protein [Deltaproteobacteria bacterium]